MSSLASSPASSPRAQPSTSQQIMVFRLEPKEAEKILGVEGDALENIKEVVVAVYPETLETIVKELEKEVKELEGKLNRVHGSARRVVQEAIETRTAYIKKDAELFKKIAGARTLEELLDAIGPEAKNNLASAIRYIAKEKYVYRLKTDLEDLAPKKQTMHYTIKSTLRAEVRKKKGTLTVILAGETRAVPR